MIRTCRLFFPARNSYNVPLFNPRTCQTKQISVEFSFYTEQRRENYLQKKSFEKVEFSTFKEHEKIQYERTQQKKQKDSISSDYVAFKANKGAQKETQSIVQASAEDMNIDFSTFKENLKSKAAMFKGDVELTSVGMSEKEDSIKPIGDDENENTFQPSINVINAGVPIYRNYKLTPQEIIKSLKIMAKTGNRATPDIKFFSHLLLTKGSSYKLKECCDVLYAYAKLSFAHLPVLNLFSKHILDALSKEEEEIIPRTLVSLLQSVCKLKYRNCELIECLCKKISEIQDLLSTEQTTLCLFALSSVNVQSVYVDHFIKILSKLKNTDFNKTRNFLNYIWASVILEKENSLPVEHLEIVLSKAFIDQLSISGDNTLLNKIKLSNISGVAADMKGYKGPLLDHLILSPVFSKAKNDFLTSVRDSLSYIFPKTGFMEALSYAGSGVFIDIECCLDSSSNPVLLKNKEKYNKVAIILLDHNDYCVENTAMTGVTTFKIARIKRQGYNVLIIPHAEFPFNSALSIKIAYLKNKFKKVLAKASGQ